MQQEKKSYFMQYYEEHRDAINASRAIRYRLDKRYRALVKKRSREYYAAHRSAVTPPGRRRKRVRIEPRMIRVKNQHGKFVEVKGYFVGDLARAVNRAELTIIAWERAGVIPKAKFRSPARWRMYTRDQIELIQYSLWECEEELVKRVRNAPILRRFGALVRERWARIPTGIGNWRKGDVNGGRAA
jgi:hypothetical protein